MISSNLILSTRGTENRLHNTFGLACSSSKWGYLWGNKQNPPTNFDCAMADLECFEQSSKMCIFIQLLAQNFLDTNLNFHQHPAINAIRYKRCNHWWAFCMGHQLKMWFHSLCIICILSCIVFHSYAWGVSEGAEKQLTLPCWRWMGIAFVDGDGGRWWWYWWWWWWWWWWW